MISNEAPTVPPDGTPMSDEDVVQRVRAGDTALFEILMRRYNRRLYRVARSILEDDGEAIDVVQDTYVRAYTHLHQFQGQAKFSTWLTKIAVHEASARVRQRNRYVELDPIAELGKNRLNTVKSTTRDPEQQMLAREAIALLEAAVDALPSIYRSVFILRDIERLSTAETAECLGLSEEAIKVRLHHARALLRKELTARTGRDVSEAFPFAGSRCDGVVFNVLNRIRSLPSHHPEPPS